MPRLASLGGECCRSTQSEDGTSALETCAHLFPINRFEAEGGQQSQHQSNKITTTNSVE